MKVQFFFTLLVTLFLGLSHSVFANQQTSIEISGAWIREAPPVAVAMAGYFKLKNASDSTITLIGFSSASFDKIELHRTELIGSVTKMVRQDRLAVPPDGVLLLEPGSYHLMLMRPFESLKEGDFVQIQIQLDSGQSLNMSAMVRKGHN